MPKPEIQMNALTLHEWELRAHLDRAMVHLDSARRLLADCKMMENTILKMTTEANDAVASIVVFGLKLREIVRQIEGVKRG